MFIVKADATVCPICLSEIVVLAVAGFHLYIRMRIIVESAWGKP